MTTTASPELSDADRRPKTKWTNDAILQAQGALKALAKIGTKNDLILQRLTQMIVWANAAIQEFFISRDTLTNTWAARDENDEIKVKVVADDKGNEGHTPIFRNAVEHNLKQNELLRGDAKYTNEPPAPFTWQELGKFQRMPDADLIAALGPFIDLSKT